MYYNVVFYLYSAALHAYSNEQVTSGRGRISLGNVECSGSEQTIADCTHNGWGTHDCDHSQDVGVECNIKPSGKTLLSQAYLQLMQ